MTRSLTARGVAALAFAAAIAAPAAQTPSPTDDALIKRARGIHDRVIALDTAHSSIEPRYFCFGRVGAGILTVRFTYRAGVIRIIGAGYWRKGRQIYERENQVHR